MREKAIISIVGLTVISLTGSLLINGCNSETPNSTESNEKHVSREESSPEKHKALGKKRITLKEAGPMIPPVPALLLSVNGDKDREDEVSVVWTFVINGKPPQIGISVEDSHVALGFLKRHKEFVLNVPTVDMVKQFDIVDMNSSKVQDKYKLSGLTRGKASIVKAPTVEESPIQLECRVVYILRVPPKRTVFIAKVLATRVLEGATDSKGKLLVNSVSFFGMTAGSGEFYTMGKRVGHIGQSVGRDDIKY